MIFLLSGCTDENKNETLVIGIDADFAPLAFCDENKNLVGFDIDLAKETAKRMGVAIKFQPINWNNKREEITSGRVDMIWNGLDITKERKEYMLFSKPYMQDRQILLVKGDSDLEFYSKYDLEGKVVGTQAGSMSDDYIRQDKELEGSLKSYKTCDRFDDIVEDLLKGEVEVIVCDELIARYKMNQYPDQLKIIDVKIGSIAEMGIGFRKDNVELRDRVQKAFDSMVKDGTARKISEKWFHADLIKSGK